MKLYENFKTFLENKKLNEAKNYVLDTIEYDDTYSNKTKTISKNIKIKGNVYEIYQRFNENFESMYVVVSKLTNNPFGTMGKEFKNWTEAANNYKSNDFKLVLKETEKEFNEFIKAKMPSDDKLTHVTFMDLGKVELNKVEYSTTEFKGLVVNYIQKFFRCDSITYALRQVFTIHGSMIMIIDENGDANDYGDFNEAKNHYRSNPKMALELIKAEKEFENELKKLPNFNIKNVSKSFFIGDKVKLDEITKGIEKINGLDFNYIKKYFEVDNITYLLIQLFLFDNSFIVLIHDNEQQHFKNWNELKSSFRSLEIGKELVKTEKEFQKVISSTPHASSDIDI